MQHPLALVTPVHLPEGREDHEEEERRFEKTSSARSRNEGFPAGSVVKAKR